MKRIITNLLTMLALSAPAYSQTTWGSVGGVTLALTFSTKQEALPIKDENGRVVTDPDLRGMTYQNTYGLSTLDGEGNEIRRVDTDEYGSKITTTRYGNANLIAELVLNGILPEKGRSPFIAGWSIIAVYENGDPTAGALPPPMIYARHTDKTTVPIDTVMIDFGMPIDATSWKRVTTSNNPPNGEPTMSESFTFNQTFKSVATGTFETSLGSITATGLLTGSVRSTAKSETLDGFRFVTQVVVPGAVKLDKILGTVDPMVIEGSVSIAAGTVTNLDTFFPAL